MIKISIEGVVDMLLSLCTRRYSDKERLLIITAWEHTLKNVPESGIKSGLGKAIDAHDGFMLPPGRFKELCLTADGCQSLEDEAMIAWSLVIRNLDATCSPVFKNSVIAEAIRKMGGWKQLCNMLTSEEPFRKRDFISYYQIISRKNKTYSPMLSGMYPDYKFIGYDKSDNLENVLLQITQKENSDRKILNMIQMRRSPANILVEKR